MTADKSTACVFNERISRRYAIIERGYRSFLRSAVMRFAIPLSILAAALVAGATTGSAIAADKTGKTAHACFRADDVRSWKFLDHQQRINLSTNRRDVFTAEVIGICPSADFSLTLGIKSRTTSFICEGDDAGLFVSNLGGAERCHMQKIRKLLPDEVAALPKDAKP
jgi:hypothetical protein